MQYGVYVPPFGAYAEPGTLVSLARDAEAAGWDGFFIWDHIAMWFSKTPPVLDAWVTLAAIAVVTGRIRIGPLVTPLARRRPWKLARECVTLDHLSGGRLTLGVGLGEGPNEFDDLGEEADPKVRAAMLDEGLSVLTGLWTGAPFSYAGVHYRVEGAHFTPPPVQQPRIPIWVAGFWPGRAPFRRAARWDGVYPLLRGDVPYDISPDTYREIVAYIAAHRESDAPFDVVHSNGGDPQDAPTRDLDRVAEYADAGVTWWLEQVNPWRFGWQGAGPWPLEAMRDCVLAGPPGA
ncbi:MAG: LLM class flavin-dependent oxidoreductase [Anaerolineae bacterium]|nr:LLM class flavin-dependent oxidoreductase [Anaerolineae bacterium]